jgi:acetylornithine deacetylase
LRALIEASAQRIGQAHGVQDGIEIIQTAAYPGLDTAPDAAVTALAQRMADTTGTTKVAFGTEAGFFAGRGIPTVVCGPGSMEGQGHKPDEFIAREQLARCDSMMARVLDHLT